ncbi:Serine incorporator 3 [Blastocladiella emersonii ATCC 22665]|nr:Serine incorporator 3 [Blastocladiella emersonii ATCC 22665]
MPSNDLTAVTSERRRCRACGCLGASSGRLFRVVCCAISVKQSIASRLLYCLGFVVLGCAAVGFKNASPKILDAVSRDTACASQTCRANLAVFRIAFAGVLYHALHMVLLAGIRSSADPRAYIQNSAWLVKAALLVGVVVGVFYIPSAHLVKFPIAALTFTTGFLLIQTFLLVDFAHSWAERCLVNYESTRGLRWKLALIGVTLLCFALTLAGVTLLYLTLRPDTPTSGSPCWLNPFLISVSLALNLAQILLSIYPRVREHNPKSGLLQSAIIAVYTTYLLVSGLAPDLYQCGSRLPISLVGSPVAVSTSSASLADVAKVGGALISTAALSYSAFGTASTRFFVSTSSNGSIAVAGEDADDETDQTVYSYSYFHLVFALACFYLSVVVSDWVTQAADDDAGSVSVAPMWVRVGTGFMVALLYMWTLVAPLVFPDRDFS